MKTFKTEIYPTVEQQKYIRKACGTRRFVYNWAKNTYFEILEDTKKTISRFDLQKLITNTLAKQDEYSWLNDVNTMVREEAIKDFSAAADKWWDAVKEGKATGDKYKPKFKKKGKCTESFRIRKKNKSSLKVESAHFFRITTTGELGPMHLRVRESLEFLFDADIKSATISIKAGKFFLAITYEKTNLGANKCGTGKVGLDAGIKHALTAWDGQNSNIFDVPENLKFAEKATERWHKRLSGKKPGSGRWYKCLIGLQRAYMHEANIRKDWQEKLTTYLVENFAQINLETFSFDGAKNLNCNRALYRIGIYEFVQRLTCKSSERGVSLNFVEPFTPTTMTCSCCGAQQKVDLQTRTYSCPHCGLTIDRDVNAAINIYNYC